jgi:hypothetical protein
MTGRRAGSDYVQTLTRLAMLPEEHLSPCAKEAEHSEVEEDASKDRARYERYPEFAEEAQAEKRAGQQENGL